MMIRRRKLLLVMMLTVPVLLSVLGVVAVRQWRQWQLDRASEEFWYTLHWVDASEAQRRSSALREAAMRAGDADEVWHVDANIGEKFFAEGDYRKAFSFLLAARNEINPYAEDMLVYVAGMAGQEAWLTSSEMRAVDASGVLRRPSDLLEVTSLAWARRRPEEVLKLTDGVDASDLGTDDMFALLLRARAQLDLGKEEDAMETLSCLAQSDLLYRGHDDLTLHFVDLFVSTAIQTGHYEDARTAAIGGLMITGAYQEESWNGYRTRFKKALELAGSPGSSSSAPSVVPPPVLWGG